MTADVFSALADPTRRRLMELLRARPRSVGELVDRVDIYQPGVSRHLRILHQAGFVDVRARGQKRIYSLRPKPFKDLDAWLGDYRTMWENRLGQLAGVVERKTMNDANSTRHDKS